MPPSRRPVRLRGLTRPAALRILGGAGPDSGRSGGDHQILVMRVHRPARDHGSDQNANHQNQVTAAYLDSH